MLQYTRERVEAPSKIARLRNWNSLFFSVLLVGFFLAGAQNTFAAGFTAAADGYWNNGPTWGKAACPCTEGVQYPGPNDSATISAHTVTLFANANVGSTTLSSTGVLNLGTSTLNVYNNLINNGLSSTFVANTGTIYLGGTNQMISGPFVFYNLTKSVTSPDTLTIDSAFVSTTVTNTLHINGTAGNLLSVRGIGYGYVTQMGTSSLAGGVFNNPQFISTDASGNLYVTDNLNNRVQKFNAAGNFISTFGYQGSSAGQFTGPQGIAVDPLGNIFVVDKGNNRIEKFDSTASFSTQWGSTGTTEGKFTAPYGMALNATNTSIYVLDQGNNRVQKFDSSGNFVSAFGYGVATGASTTEVCTSSCRAGFSTSGNGGFNKPVGIAVSSTTGYVYVVDQSNSRIQEFDQSGNYIRKWGSFGSTGGGQFNTPIGISIDLSDNVYVVDNGNYRVQKFNSTGTFISTFGWGVTTGASTTEICTSSCKRGFQGSGNGQINNAVGLINDPAGNYVYVVDGGNGQIQKYDSSGNYISSFGKPSSADGVFNTASNATIDSTGNIIISDYGNNRIQKISPTGTFLAKWGTIGSTSAQLSGPYGVALDVSGDIYVTDRANNRVIEYNSSGVFVSTFGWGVTDGTVALQQCTSGCRGGISGAGAGQFNGPYGIAIATSTGDIYVADQTNNRIQEFDSTGAFIRTFGWGVTNGAAAFQRCTSGCQTGSSGSGNGQFNTLFGLAVDPTQTYLYSLEKTGGRVQEFDLSGNYVSKWGSSGSGNGQFSNPQGITVDPASGNVFVADSFNYRIEGFDSIGNYLTKWGSQGSGNGQFYLPSMGSFDSNGNLYVVNGSSNVTNPNSGVIQKFHAYWAINSQGTTSVSYASIKDSQNANVSAISCIGCTDAGNNTNWNFVATLTVPDAPTGVTAATSSPNQATITFTPGSNGGSSILYYLASSTPSNITATSTGSPIIVTGLTNGTSYTFKVMAINAQGTSTPSVASNAVTPTAAFTIPTMDVPTANSTTTTSVTFSGNILGTGGVDPTIEGFNYGTTTAYGSTTQATGDFSTGIYSLYTNDLACATTYHFRAFATNSVGTGSSTDQTFSTGACASLNVAFTVNGSGIRTLIFNGFTYINATAPTLITLLNFVDGSGNVTTGDTAVQSQTTDGDGLGTVIGYSWGSIHLRYSAVGNKLYITPTVTNTSANTIQDLELKPMLLNFPSALVLPFNGVFGSDGTQTPLVTNWGNPSILYMTYTGGTIAVANEDVVQPLFLGNPYSLSNFTPGTFPLTAGVGESFVPNTFPALSRSISPGNSDTYTLSIRFGTSTQTLSDLAGDMFTKFTQQYPFKLNWPDRRPIGSDFLSNNTATSTVNSRGWLGHTNTDYTSPAGIQQLRTDMLARADTEVQNLKAINAQGLIVWDIESTDPHNLSYIGDPRKLPALAPEMDAVADAFFKKFTDAGFRVGVTIRPQLFSAGTSFPGSCSDGDIFVNTSLPYGQQEYGCQSSMWIATTSQQKSQSTAVEESQMIDKIVYAMNRWGATLFYVDSFGSYPPTTISILNDIMNLYPNILLIPESSKNSAYFSVSTPYHDPGIEQVSDCCGTQIYASTLYPGSASLVNMAHLPLADFSSDFNSLVAGVQRGDMLLLGSWFSGNNLTQVNQVYAAAGQYSPWPPAVSATSTTNVTSTSVTLNGSIDVDGSASSTARGFVYGLSTSYGATTTETGTFGIGNYSASAPNLILNTTYHYTAYATNPVGTAYGSDKTFTTSDITAPTVSLTIPSGGTTVAGASVPLSSTATDDVGVVGVQFMLDGTTNIGSLVTSTSSPNTYTTTWNSTGITTYGSHTIYAVVHDAGGNYATSTVSINVDNVAPTLVSAVYNSDTRIIVTLSKLADSSTITKSNDGGFTVTKTGSGTTYPVTSIAPGSGNSVVLTTASMTAAGVTGVIVTYSNSGNGTVADPLGNLLATDNTGQTIPPWNTTVPIISNLTSTVSDGAYKQGASIDIDLTFSKTIDSSAGLTVNLNSGGSCSTGAISDSATASCIYTVGGNDNASALNVSSVIGLATSTDGNAMTSFTPAHNLSYNKNIVVDTTAPTVSLTAPSNGATVSGSSVTLTASHSDNGSGIAGVQFKLDGTNIGSSGATNPYSITWDSTSSSNASHTLYAVAEDVAGNYATSSINITIDNTIHTYSIGGSVSGLTGTLILQNNSGDNLTLTSNGSFTFNTSIANGSPYSVTVLTQPSEETCSVSGGSGNVSSSNVTNVSITCTANPVTPAPIPTVTPTKSYSSGGGSVSTSYIPITTTTPVVPGCPAGLICTPIPGFVSTSTNPITVWIPASAGMTNSVFTRDLTLGFHGSDVTELQNFLILHNYLGSIYNTGYFGSLTQTALAKYQSDNGITPASGYYGPKTRAFMAGNAVLPSSQTSTPPPVLGVPTIGPNGITFIVPANEQVSFTIDLTLGSKGDDVKALQEYLNSHGFTVAKKGAGSPGHETTYFGPATKAAVIKFQDYYAKDILTPNGLSKGTGYFGPATMREVNGMVK